MSKHSITSYQETLKIYQPPIDEKNTSQQSAGIIDRVAKLAENFFSSVKSLAKFLCCFVSIQNENEAGIYPNLLKQINDVEKTQPKNPDEMRKEDIDRKTIICKKLLEKITQKLTEISGKKSETDTLKMRFQNDQAMIAEKERQVNAKKQALEKVTFNMRSKIKDPDGNILSPDIDSTVRGYRHKNSSVEKDQFRDETYQNLSRLRVEHNRKIAELDEEILILNKNNITNKQNQNKLQSEIEKLEKECQIAEATLEFKQKEIMQLEAEKGESVQNVEAKIPLDASLPKEPKFTTSKLLKKCFETFKVPFPSEFDFDAGGNIPLDSPIYIYLNDENSEKRACYLFGLDADGKSTGGISYSVDPESGAITFNKGFTEYRVINKNGYEIPVFTSIEQMKVTKEGQNYFFAKINLYKTMGWTLYSTFSGQVISTMKNELNEVNLEKSGYVTFSTKPLDIEETTKKWDSHTSLTSLDEFKVVASST